MADLGAQAIIHASLKTYSPNDQMIAEETSSTLNEFKEISVFLQLLSQSLGYPVTLTDVCL